MDLSENRNIEMLLPLVARALKNGGGVTPEQIQAAVDQYLTENPVQAGATEEQVQQIEQNKNDIKSVSNAIFLALPYSQNEGYYIAKNNKWLEAANFITTDPIKVDANVFPRIHLTYENINSYVAAVAFSENAESSRPTITNVVSFDGDGLEYEVEIPENAKYMFLPVSVVNEGKKLNCIKHAYFYMSDLIETGKIISPLSVTTDKIAPKAVTYEKQSFVEEKTGNNIYDQNSMIAAKGKWYERIGATVNIVENQYTKSYICVDIPIDFSKTKINIDIKQYGNIIRLYNYFFTDNFDVYLGTEIVNAYMNEPVIAEIPQKSTHIKINFYCSSDIDVLEKSILMVNYGEAPLEYEEYYKNIVINGSEFPEMRYVDKAIDDKMKSELNHQILKIPRKFDLVVGDTFEMFYKGISNVLDSGHYDYELTYSDNVARGKAWKNKYEYTPEEKDIGTKTIDISVRDNTGKIVDSGSVQLVISNKPTSPGSNKNVLCIGDSLTANGVWCEELKRRLTASGGTPVGYGLSNITFIGTADRNGCKYEGYGGWTFNSFLTENKSDAFMNIIGTFDKANDDQHSVYKDANSTEWKLETIGSNKIKIIRVSSSGTLPASGTLTWVSGGNNHSNIIYDSSEQASGNPFWSVEKGKNDFTAYATRMGANSIDYAIILLGWNSTGDTEETYKNYTKQFIDGLLTDYPNCKIILLGLEIPAKDGLANNYGTSRLASYYKMMQHVWNLNKWYQDIADEYENADFLNISGQFDTEHNMQTMKTNVNVRNSEQITIQSNGVHPAESGYLQIADAVTRNFVTKIN